MSDDWKRGLRMLDRGLYVDEKDGALHIDAKEMLEAAGYVPSEHNARILLDCARSISRHIGAELHELDE